MTSATEKLRALLDERGVEWKAIGDRYTEYGNMWAIEYGGINKGLTLFNINSFTPEQAIEATLGRTCEYCMDGSFDGQTVMMSNHGWQRINFCPNCGARVVKRTRGDAE